MRHLIVDLSSLVCMYYYALISSHDEKRIGD